VSPLFRRCLVPDFHSCLAMDGAVSRSEAVAQIPDLAEWLSAYPKLGAALQACCLRFVVSLPDTILCQAPRLCFELQEAFWFYLDYFVENAKRELPKLNQSNFLNLMLESSELLCSIYNTPKARQTCIQEWRSYCTRVPLRGAVLLNASLDKCLMVKPWKGDKWTFPRGKINQDESEDDCAVREVWEETGVDIKGRIVASQYVKADIYGTGTIVKLFLVPGFSEQTHYTPHTRKEISEIGWVPLKILPGWPGGDDSRQKFVDVRPFMTDLHQWVEDQLGNSRSRPLPVPRPAPSSAEEVAARPMLQPTNHGRPAREATAATAADAAPLGWLDIDKILRAFDAGWEEGDSELKTKRNSSAKVPRRDRSPMVPATRRDRSPMVPAAPRNSRTG